MTTNMRNVLKLSTALRSLSTPSNRALSLRLFHSSSASEARFNRPVLSSEARLPGRALDILEDPEKPAKSGTINQQLRECQRQEEVFELIKKEVTKMNGFQALRTLETLFDIEKKIPDRNPTDLIYQKKEFALLCDTLKKHIRQLSPKQALEALKYLTFFNVPSATVIVQLLLQMLRTSVNQLTLDEILFLSFLLKKCQKTPLVEALDIALPIVFETQVKTQLNSENLDSLVNILQYLRQLSINSDVVSRILNIFETKYSSKIAPAQAKQILFCLLDWECDERVKNLVPKMMEIMAGGMDELNETELKAILRRIKKNFVKENYEIYYHEGFADACAATVISRDLGFFVALEVVNFFNEVEHVNIAMLDYMAAKCFEDPNILKNANKYQIGSLLYSFSQADYKPVFWDTIKESLMSQKLLDSSAGRLTKVALYLATLDCYWPEMLEKTFGEFEPRGEKHISCRKRLLLLYQAVKNCYPEYTGPWPSEEILEYCRTTPSIEKQSYPLKSAIEAALGGPQYVMTKLKTRLGYYVDHVVIMRKGGFPIAMNNAGEPMPEKVEDLKPLHESQVLIFLDIPTYGYTRNTDRLTGYWSFLIKQLESGTKHTVIPIHSRMWTKMSEPEQVRYISQAIRLKCDELSAVVN